MWNYVAPLAGSSTAGLIMLAGDLAGTSSAYNTPRVGRLTGETSGADQVVMMRNGAVLALTDAESLATVASTGQIRTSHSKTIMAFLNVNSNNANIITTDGSNNIMIGDAGATANVSGVYLSCVSTGTLGFQVAAVNRMTVTSAVISAGANVIMKIPGAGTASTNGDLNFGHSTEIHVLIGTRNAGNNADISIVQTDATNNIYFGPNSGTNNTYINSTAATVLRANSASVLTASTTAVTLGTGISLKLAGTVADAGEIRAAKATNIIMARNNANDANIALLATNDSNEMYIGLSAAGTLMPALVYIDNVSGCNIRVNNTTRLAVTSTYVGIQSAGSAIASVGDLRFHTATARTIIACDANAVGENIAIVATDASDYLYLGGTSAAANQAVRTFVQASSKVNLIAGTIEHLTCQSSIVYIGSTGGTAIALGVTNGQSAIANGGDIRMGTLTERTLMQAPGGGGQVAIISASAGLEANDGDIYIGSTSAFANQARYVFMNSSAWTALAVGGVERIAADTTGLGFFGSAPIAKPNTTGSRGGNAALASLLTNLANLGLITDSTTA